MPATFTIPTVTVIPGQTITASLWNNEFNSLYTNFIPAGMGSFSNSNAEMQTQTDPYPATVISRATSLQGELERFRYALAQHSGNVYWYQPAITTISGLNARAHDLENKFPLATGSYADLSVTTQKLANGSVTDDKMHDVAATKITGQVVNAQILSLDANKLNGTLPNNSVVASSIVNGNVGSNQLANGSVTDAKINDVAATKITGHLAGTLKSINSYTNTAANGASTIDTTITSVDTSKAVVITTYGFVNLTANEFTTSTNVRSTLSGTSGSRPIHFTVIEFY